MEDDAVLLQRYAQNRDASAFAELVRRYAGYVFGTCLRITGNAHDAEDVSQECFLELARRAGSVGSSLAGWLHAAATHRACNSLRRAGTRRRHETKASTNKPSGDGPTWAEIAPHVDRVLDEMPESLSVPLILHYMRGRTQSEIASELGVSQPTVSRCLNKGVAALRGKLAKAGVIAPAIVIAALLTENAASSAPVTSNCRTRQDGHDGDRQGCKRSRWGHCRSRRRSDCCRHHDYCPRRAESTGRPGCGRERVRRGWVRGVHAGDPP